VTPDPAGGNGTTINQLSDGTLIVSAFHWAFADLGRPQDLAHCAGVRELRGMGLLMGVEGIYTCRSRTEGYTWDAPRKVDTGGLWQASSAGRIVEAPDGALLMPANAKLTEDSVSQFVVFRSTDQGETWRRWAMAPVAGCDVGESRIVVLPEGRMLALHRTRDRNFLQCSSEDGGETWSEAVETPMWSGSSSPADLLLLADGRLLCTYGRRKAPLGVRACLSEDGGRTWRIDQETILRDDGLAGDMGYPSSEQMEDGSILTVYYWHNEDQIRCLEGSRWSLDERKG